MNRQCRVRKLVREGRQRRSLQCPYSGEVEHVEAARPLDLGRLNHSVPHDGELHSRGTGNTLTLFPVALNEHAHLIDVLGTAEVGHTIELHAAPASTRAAEPSPESLTADASRPLTGPFPNTRPGCDRIGGSLLGLRLRAGTRFRVRKRHRRRLGDGVGHRIHGDQSKRRSEVGYEYAHVAIDDATRLAYVEVRRSQRRRACAAFLQHALTWFRRRGIRARRVLTDNGASYKSRRFAGVCRTWQLRHRFTRPYTPRTNGKAERFIQTLLREWAYRHPFTSSRRRTAALRPYLRFYNHRRPHASLGRRSPWMRFQEAA